jgi:hypothetical protein
MRAVRVCGLAMTHSASEGSEHGTGTRTLVAAVNVRTSLVHHAGIVNSEQRLGVVRRVQEFGNGHFSEMADTTVATVLNGPARRGENVMDFVNAVSVEDASDVFAGARGDDHVFRTSQVALESDIGRTACNDGLGERGVVEIPSE